MLTFFDSFGGAGTGIANFFGAIPFAYAFRLFHDIILVLDAALLATLFYVLIRARALSAEVL